MVPVVHPQDCHWGFIRDVLIHRGGGADLAGLSPQGQPPPHPKPKNFLWGILKFLIESQKMRDPFEVHKLFFGPHTPLPQICTYTWIHVYAYTYTYTCMRIVCGHCA